MSGWSDPTSVFALCIFEATIWKSSSSDDFSLTVGSDSVLLSASSPAVEEERDGVSDSDDDDGEVFTIAGSSSLSLSPCR